jgi:hypothetical protein
MSSSFRKIAVALIASTALAAASVPIDAVARGFGGGGHAGGFGGGHVGGFGGGHVAGFAGRAGGWGGHVGTFAGRGFAARGFAGRGFHGRFGHRRFFGGFGAGIAGPWWGWDYYPGYYCDPYYNPYCYYGGYSYSYW